MWSTFFLFGRFYIVKLYKNQPIAMFGLVFALCALIAANVFLLLEWQYATAAHDDLAQMTVSKKPQAPTLAETPLGSPVALPSFRSSVLVAAINDVADDSDLVLNEVSYALDDSKNQPFLRYRVVLTVAAAYPQVRRFVEHLMNQIPHLTLDGFSCSRSEPNVLVPTCDLTLSGLFAKGKGGRG